MRVLVTGATGFIGSAIVARIASDQFVDHRITGLARTVDTGRVDAKLQLLPGDITCLGDMERLEAHGPFDAVIHSAGLAHQFGDISDADFEKTNVQGTRNVANLAQRVRAQHFILISSTAVYGIQDGMLDENSECRAGTAYAKSKLDAELICREVCERDNIPLTILRLAPVVGEKALGNVPRLISAIGSGRFIWIGKGRNRKALIYVGDVAEACRKLLKQKRGRTEIFNLAAEPIEMTKLVNTISATLGKRVPRIRIPGALPRSILSLNSKTLKLQRLEKLSQTLEKWLCEDLFIAEKIDERYGFRPAVSIEDAVRMQCRWFLERRN
jgi:nucleoside-diphosphate-sugar epimerase